MSNKNDKFFFTANGYSNVPNTLFDFQQELGINNDELLFLIRVNRIRPGSITKDENFDKTLSHRTLQRYRASLKEKGLLSFKNVVDSRDGNYVGQGIRYDLSPLWAKLQELTDNLEAKGGVDVTYYTTDLVDETVNDQVDENSYLKFYLDDYKKQYGVEYKLQPIEKTWFDSLDVDSQKAIAYSVQYAKNIKGKKIVPNLKLFYSTKWRFDDLKEKAAVYYDFKEKNGLNNFGEFVIDYFSDFYYRNDLKIPSWYKFTSKVETRDAMYAVKSAVGSFVDLHSFVPQEVFDAWKEYKFKNKILTREDNFGYTISEDGSRVYVNLGNDLSYTTKKPVFQNGEFSLVDKYETQSEPIVLTEKDYQEIMANI